MKLLPLVIFFQVIISACGDSHQNISIDPELAPLLEVYLSKAPNDGHLDEVVSIQFGDPGADKAGITELSVDYLGPLKYKTQKKITMNREIFNSPIGKRFYLHELGHALHNLPHTDNPDDIMCASEKLTKAELAERNEFWRENLILKLEEMFKI